jgi:uncharacterized membrane protein YbhN (UPF0104 family)
LGETQSQKTRWVVLILINLVSLGCLVWALHDVSWVDLKEDMATINYWWVALAGAFELSVYLMLGYVNDGLGLSVLAGTVILGLALFRPRPPRSSLGGGGWRHHLAILMDDLARIGHSRYLYFALLQSVPYLLLQVIPIWAAFQAYGFDLGLGAAFALMLILRLSSIVPQAPANLGLFQILTKEFLERAYNVDPSEAARFSLVLWGVVKVMPLIAGFIALAITGARVGELKKAAERESQSGEATVPASS